MKLDLKNNPIDRLRLASISEGASFLVLLGIAMPLKHFLGIWQAVRVVGSLHGALFIALCFLLFTALLDKRLSFKWCVIVFVCSFIPFAPFFVDRRLQKGPAPN